MQAKLVTYLEDTARVISSEACASLLAHLLPCAGGGRERVRQVYLVPTEPLLRKENTMYRKHSYMIKPEMTSLTMSGYMSQVQTNLP